MNFFKITIIFEIVWKKSKFFIYLNILGMFKIFQIKSMIWLFVNSSQNYMKWCDGEWWLRFKKEDPHWISERQGSLQSAINGMRWRVGEHTYLNGVNGQSWRFMVSIADLHCTLRRGARLRSAQSGRTYVIICGSGASVRVPLQSPRVINFLWL